VKAADQADEQLGDVRYDIAGWISGPSLDPLPPPYSSKRRAWQHATAGLAQAITMALALALVRHRAGRAFVSAQYQGPGQADTPGPARRSWSRADRGRRCRPPTSIRATNHV
jgi:hypothetical protein